jgi:thiol-disulfide isomerase/thioredoxin
MLGIGVAALTLGLMVRLNYTPQAAPVVQFTTIQQQVIKPTDLAGKPYVVNFWATSCTTCVEEMPQLQQLHQTYKDRGLKVIAVAMQYDPANYVLNFAKTRQLPFDVVVDGDGQLAQKFQKVQLTPTYFVVGGNGAILKRYVGRPDFAEMTRLIETDLAKTVPKIS